MNNQFKNGVPRLSVTAAGFSPIVGECQACGEAKARLGWRERELGLICRPCAIVLIEAEMGLIFPKVFLPEGGKDE